MTIPKRNSDRPAMRGHIATPSEKAARTSRWARIMVKWLITSVRVTRKWEIVNFTGPAGCESRGIVDLLAIRKDHRGGVVGRGDFFEMILVQVKGGSAPWPTPSDIRRLHAVEKHYNVRHVVLAEWKKGHQPVCHVLSPFRRGAGLKEIWTETAAASIFR